MLEKIKSAVKAVVPENSRLFCWIYLNLYRRPAPDTISGILHAYSSSTGKVNFIQVGANDGVFGDPIQKFITLHGWDGVLIEPIPSLFERLRENYRGAVRSHLQFENVAIAPSGGEREIYFIQPTDGLPRWLSQLGSFERAHLEKTKERFPLARISSAKVPCVTLMDLVDKYKITELDVLNIDTEGYDFEVLKTLDFKRLRPRFIAFEHVHLKDQREPCYAYLRQEGYQLKIEENDTLAMRG